jgi:hypothetical protein
MPGPPFPPPAATRKRPCRPPLFPSLDPGHRADFFQNECQPSSRPCSALSPLIHARATEAVHSLPRPNLPVALPSSQGPVSRRDLAGAAISSLSFVRHPPSLSSPNPWPSLTSLQSAGCVTNHRGSPKATGVVGAPPSQSSSSTSTSPARSGGFPPSSRCSAHSPCNTADLGIGPAAPRASARQR